MKCLHSDPVNAAGQDVLKRPPIAAYAEPIPPNLDGATTAERRSRKVTLGRGLRFEVFYWPGNQFAICVANVHRWKWIIFGRFAWAALTQWTICRGCADRAIRARQTESGDVSLPNRSSEKMVGDSCQGGAGGRHSWFAWRATTGGRERRRRCTQCDRRQFRQALLTPWFDERRAVSRHGGRG